MRPGIDVKLNVMLFRDKLHVHFGQTHLYVSDSVFGVAIRPEFCAFASSSGVLLIGFTPRLPRWPS